MDITTLFFYAGWSLFAAVVLYGLFRYRAQIFRFISEVRIELNKCSWPWDPKLDMLNVRKYRELIEQTLIVIVSALLLGGTITLFDLLFQPSIGLLTGAGLSK